MLSSPHLVHVRERIRINGHPMSEEQFAQRFFEVYDKVHELVCYFIHLRAILIFARLVGAIKYANACVF